MAVAATVSSNASLCQFDAEWIVEDFEECDGDDCGLVPFANFGQLQFTEAEATTLSGTVVVPSEPEAIVIDILQNDVQLTVSGVVGGLVTVTYIG